jgi:hypothetical protein
LRPVQHFHALKVVEQRTVEQRTAEIDLVDGNGNAAVDRAGKRQVPMPRTANELSVPTCSEGAARAIWVRSLRFCDVI